MDRRSFGHLPMPFGTRSFPFLGLETLLNYAIQGLWIQRPCSKKGVSATSLLADERQRLMCASSHLAWR